MVTAAGLVLLVSTVLLVTAASKKVGVASPLLLIVVGILASYVPLVPEIELSPDVVLFGLLPPLLYSASLSTSLVDFRKNRRAILLLSVALVAVTAGGVAVVAHVLVPGLPWTAALALGAVVAPPDAVAATAIGRRIGLPRRLVTILEGESLLNDATALVALRTALASTVAVGTVIRDFAVAAGGGVLVGVVVYLAVARIRRRIRDPLLCAGVLVTVIVLRMAWMFLARYVLVRPYLDPTTRERPSPAYTVVLGWAGMRGVVTVAAAFVIPSGVPYRDVLLLAAFGVVVGSVLLQGTTLPALARRLELPPPDPAADARARSEVVAAASRKAMAAVAELAADDPHGVVPRIAEDLERRRVAAAGADDGRGAEGPTEAYARIRRRMIAVERDHILAVRDDGTVSHEVISELLGMLDVEETVLEGTDRG